MTDIKEIFADNLRENRRKCGLTQAELAEKADISTHYVAMIETTKNFPKGDIIERIAKALEIDIFELFVVQNKEKEIKEMNKTVIKEIKNIIDESIENALNKRNL